MTGTTLKNLTAWLQAYRDSVGSPADECLKLYERLLQGKLANGSNPGLLEDLLNVMSGLSPDPRTVSCAMLFVASECGEDLAPIRTDLSREVNDQLDQLLYLIELETEHLPASSSHSAEGLRRMLLALVKDVRVVLIALTWQLVKLRRAKDQQTASASLAREAMLIHAPLANRLGVWQLKWELEDLAFRIEQPEDYRRMPGWSVNAVPTAKHLSARLSRNLRQPSAAPGSQVRSRAVPSTFTVSGGKCSARAWISTNCLMSGRCACW